MRTRIRRGFALAFVCVMLSGQTVCAAELADNADNTVSEGNDVSIVQNNADGADLYNDGYISTEYGRLYYDILADDFNDLDEQVVYIQGYYGSDTVVRIPEEIDGMKVYALVNAAFQNNTTVEEIYLPENMRKIEFGAFYGCSSLRVIDLGGLQGPLEWHGLDGLLDRCTSLESITMSDSADFEITSSDGKNFGIFYSDVRDHLKSIYIGSGMKSVSENLFYGDALEKIEVGENNPNYSSYNGVLYSADGKELLVCGTAYPNAYYEIPDGVEAIGSIGFQFCSLIQKIKIPSSVTSIGVSSFKGTTATLLVDRGSYAAQFAVDKELPVEYTTAREPSRGDVNGDGAVDIKDARMMLQGISGKIALSPQQTERADVMEDGNVDVSDLRRMLLYICGKIEAEEL